MRRELETLDAFDQHAASEGTLRGCAVQALDLTGRETLLASIDVHGALFLGCRLSARASDLLARRGALVFPRLPDVPFDAYRAGLYTAHELYLGLSGGYDRTPDGRAYRWFSHQDAGQLDGTLARALHDHAIADALAEANPDPTQGVGIMGGHASVRGSDDYRRTAHLAQALAASGRLVVTGGGPGAMEAANLGASLVGNAEQVDAACADLAAVPTFRPSVKAWAEAGFGIRERYGCTGASIGVPTWFYGHEPPNVFASHIAKFFDNAVREDILIGLCGGGIVFSPGAAGTVQELFQSVTRCYYATEASGVRPLVLLGRDFWTTTVPAWPLLRSLASGRLMEPHIHLVDSTDELLDALGAPAA